MLVNKSVYFKQIGEDKTVTFAGSAAANTQKTVDITIPMPREVQGIVINNPSASDLTVKVFNKEVIGQNTKYAYITSFVVPKSQTITGTTIDTYFVMVEGMGTSVRLVVSNNSALGADGGFIATFRLREVV